jgi:hypothetical protein
MTDKTSNDEPRSVAPLASMRRNLSVAGANGAVVLSSAALEIASQLAMCSIAEDVHAIRQLLEAQRAEPQS